MKESSSTDSVDLLFNIQGTPEQLKGLFRLRDDATAVLEIVTTNEMDTVDTLYITLSFYYKYLSFSEKLTSSLEIKDSEWPLTMKENGDLNCMEKIVPIKLHFKTKIETKEKIKSYIQLISDKLSNYYKTSPHSIDDYFVILMALKFFKSKNKEIYEFYDSSFCDNIDTPCEICGDLGCYPSNFCGSSAVCGKCIRFFLRFVDQRSELHCSKVGNCSSQNDINCHQCRMQRFLALGLINEYYSFSFDAKKPSTNCWICHESSEKIKLFSGYPLCFQCRGFIARSLFKNTFQSYRCDSLGNCSNDVIWVGKSLESSVCTYCLFRKIRGIFEGPMLERDCETTTPESKESECLGCGKELSENESCDLYFGLNCCSVCRMFLRLSMVQDVRFDYVCSSYGEINSLCTIEPNIEPWTPQCNYCWFRVLEIEGFVDRFTICNGNPELWMD